MLPCRIGPTTILFVVMAVMLIVGFVFWVAAAATYDRNDDDDASFWARHNDTVSALQGTAYAFFALTIIFMFSGIGMACSATKKKCR